MTTAHIGDDSCIAPCGPETETLDRTTGGAS
jgi:hypothetical protein